ncbi:hypothetical protein GWI33_000136 [Rhynchophorus ferrugineus]|uniref:Uncharacterized protein n=1 Tax=Rhynchophorus ferrugineus TaxID=354439 RepID=A0A834J0P2_RHYFE|nr:hypothetical protein GWI33_000136 [Rhynchophorus ferrugineus]
MMKLKNTITVFSFISAEHLYILSALLPHPSLRLRSCLIATHSDIRDRSLAEVRHRCPLLSSQRARQDGSFVRYVTKRTSPLSLARSFQHNTIN